MRKEPKKWLKTTPKIPGIYVIENTVNGMKYVGGSKRVLHRINDHVVAMRNTILNYRAPFRGDIEKYGVDAFKIYIIEFCDREEIAEREIYYIEKFNTLDPQLGYNKRTPSMLDYMSQKETKMYSDKKLHMQY